MQDRYKNRFPATLVFSIGLMLLGLTLEAPMDILKGLYHIVTMQDLLITDYVSIGGPGAALVNAGLILKSTGAAGESGVKAISQSLPPDTQTAQGTVVTVQMGQTSTTAD